MRRVHREHARPVRSRTSNNRRRTPRAASICASDDLHLSTIDLTACARLISHEVSNKCASNVDDLRSTGFLSVGCGVYAATGVPGQAIVLRNNGIDAEATKFGVFENAAVKMSVRLFASKNTERLT